MVYLCFVFDTQEKQKKKQPLFLRYNLITWKKKYPIITNPPTIIIIQKPKIMKFPER